MSLKRRYESWLNLGLNKTFDLWQFLGFHVTPNHFYSPLPDTRSWRIESGPRNPNSSALI
jgi:hypothetical protein